MVAGQFVHHDGGIIMFVLSVNLSNGTFMGCNLKSSNLKQSEYRTRNTSSAKVSISDLKKLWSKMEGKYTDQKVRERIELEIQKLEKLRAEESEQETSLSSKKGIKTKYVNNFAMA